MPGSHPLFDGKWYLEQNPDVAAANIDPFEHYMASGWGEGRNPHILFNVAFYLQQCPHIAGKINPLVHYVNDGWRMGLDPNPLFRTSFYLQDNPDVDKSGVNPLVHYVTQGWKDGRNPHPDFDAPAYAAKYKAVAEAGIDPLSHFYRFGKPSENAAPSVALYHSKFSQPGPDFQEFDPSILQGVTPAVKAFAFYLPQFHAFPENDAFWGAGFTEWRQLVRGLPRFPSHYQPRTPRDLGHYDLSDPAVMPRQFEMARQAGIHGFGIYYYWFNGKRVMQRPLDQLLASENQIPFFLIWTNENWTRTWDGSNSSVLLQQDYREEDEPSLLADLARHFADDRYYKIGGRPLFVIYKASDVPDAYNTFARWKERWKTDHGIEPLFFMAQTFNTNDPHQFGLDGAIEFPPHKLLANNWPRPTPDAFDPDFSGQVFPYHGMMRSSLSEPCANYPLIKTAFPSWDNDARRPGRGMTIEGSAPQKFESWMIGLLKKARQNTVFGEPVVAINAWNEWAEGAYLEPDVHYGSAYLNAVARALKSVSTA